MGHQQRVFERFYQVDPSRAGFTARRGTGLGLAIVKHALKALGGTIQVESVWKEGTRMIVELPVQARVEAAQPAAAE
jgi:signal transduction histidine kinase